MIKNNPLINYGNFVNEKVANSKLTTRNYIGNDNLLSNFQGILDSVHVPSDGSSTAVKPNDILIGNIRPYLKKIWKSNFIGGCSNDVLNFRVNNSADTLFLYYCLTNDDFISHIMSGSKGTKMPRGDKSHILKYEVPILPEEQRKIIGNLFDLIDRRIQNNLEICKLFEALGRNYFKLTTSNLSKSNNVIRDARLSECLVRNSKKISEKINSKLIDLSVMPEDSIILFGTNDSKNFETNLFELEVGDFLIGSIRPYLKKVGVSPINGMNTGTVLSYKAKDSTHAAFLLFLLDSDDFKDYLIRCSKGTKMPVIDSDIVLNYSFQFSEALIVDFNKNYNFLKIIIGLVSENLELKQLKEQLLPLALANKAIF
jgi:restriction endonuclease S subunit